MRKQLLILILPSILVLSCQKNQHDAEVPKSNPVTDYFPTTTGSSWTYAISDGDGGSNGNFTVTATNEHIQKDGRAFAVLSGGSILPNAGLKTYIYKTADQYKTYYTIVHDELTGIDFDIPILLNRRILNKDTSYYISGTDPSKPPAWQVVLKDIKQDYQDFTVKGVTYKNCLVTIVDILKRNEDTASMYYGTYQVYYTSTLTFAPNVGLIETALYGKIFSLVSSGIKP